MPRISSCSRMRSAQKLMPGHSYSKLDALSRTHVKGKRKCGWDVASTRKGKVVGIFQVVLVTREGRHRAAQADQKDLACAVERRTPPATAL